MAAALLPSFPGVVFPVARSGPMFDTLVSTAVSGKETAYANRVTPKWQWQLGFDILRSDAAHAEMQRLAGFYAACFGRLIPFAYTDAEDNQAANQQFGTGDGATTRFQLVRALSGFVEPVFLPSGVPAIAVAGVVLTPASDYTLQPGGVVAFAQAPAQGAPLVWSGSFDWLCRFDEDKLDFKRFMVGLWSLDKLSFSSVLP